MSDNANCTCSSAHPISGRRATGEPVALWTCPRHGNVFEELGSGISLTPFEREVLAVISEGARTADEISRWLNCTIARAERAIAALQSAGFIDQDRAPKP